MNIKQREDYEAEDFLTDESFLNFHFQLSTKDELSWKEWLSNHPDKNEVVYQARELAESLTLSISDNEYKVELQKLKESINVSQPGTRPLLFSWSKISQPLGKIKRILLFILPALIAIIWSGYIFIHSSPVSPNHLTETTNNKSTPAVITLSDGTLVSLAPHSTLKYALSFQQNERNVYLSGEAQFHVMRNEHAPFKVFSENLVATVLGTVFNFKKSGDSSIVELLQGKLKVKINDNSYERSMLLHPDEKAIYVKHDQAFYKTSISPLNAFADIQFHQNNFEEVAGRIKTVFGVTVVNKSSNRLWRFTGNFKNTTAKDVIESICLVKGLSAEVSGNIIYIK